MDLPTVSIVIPSFNHAKYVRAAIDSVLNQSFADIELIVVDDGSSDQSRDRIGEVRDPRMRVVHQTNQGAHAAINHGLSMARGRYLGILNSDDIYETHRLDRLIHALEENPTASLACSYISLIDSAGKITAVKHGHRDLHPWPLRFAELSFRSSDQPEMALFTENHLATTSNFLFPRRTWEEVGAFLQLRYAHDWDWALRAISRGTLCMVSEALMRYRLHSSNTIRENPAALTFETCWVLARHLGATSGFRADLERLAYSINLAGCEPVLIALMSRDLSSNLNEALNLLHPDHPERLACIRAIQHLRTTEQVSSGLQHRLSQLIKRGKSWLSR
jgi:glycosyltransferase involved in cell wall biosynthesis